MTSADLLTDSFGRIDEVVGEVLDGLTVAELTSRLDDGANSIAWLIWAPDPGPRRPHRGRRRNRAGLDFVGLGGAVRPAAGGF